ncbi:hypothetical protein MMC26_007691, partial [Xylographa opegraphella]|nr:hypothetical protein [Xylographa opegraphella]
MQTISNGTRIFVASIGNPPPNALTFHSAGHILSCALVSLLAYPPFLRSTSPTGLMTTGTEYTLYQSPALMNVSGKPVVAAYRTFVKDLSPEERPRAKLLVLHDDLESPLGNIKLKVGGSAKGHNGIKDIIKALGGANFMRIGVGIGRPKSRESRDVANFVLRKMTIEEITRVQNGAEKVLIILKNIR